MGHDKKRIGNYLIRDEVITHEQFVIALKIHDVTKEKIGDIVVQQNFCTREQVVDSMNKHCPDDLVGSSVTDISLPKKFLIDTETIDKGNNGTDFFIATLHDDPQWVKETALKILKKNPNLMNKNINIKIMESDIAEVRTQLLTYESDVEQTSKIKVEDEDDVNKIIDSLICEADERHASDIHIINTDKVTKILFRIFGIMHHAHYMDKQSTTALMARIKGLMGADTTNTRIQQDGNFTATINGRDIDLRIATSPIRNGELIVIRLLNRENIKKLSELGINKENDIREIANRTKGVFLVCGPTGSGKTTSLYSIMQEIDCLHLNVRTIEDPIEYNIPHVTQTQVNRLVGLDFREFCRGILRQDPDYILVGELRDRETVESCIHMADTGHAVFASIHSDSIPTTFTRLENLEVDMSKFGFALNGILIQNLVRRICPVCRKVKRDTCKHCENTGYYDRTPIIEFIKIDSYQDYIDLQNNILNNITTYYTFEDDARNKVQQGITDCEEISKRLKKKIRFCQNGKCLNGGELCTL